MIELEYCLEIIHNKMPKGKYPYEFDREVLAEIRDTRDTIINSAPELFEIPLASIRRFVQILEKLQSTQSLDAFSIIRYILVLIEEAEKKQYSELEIYNALRCV